MKKAGGFLYAKVFSGRVLACDAEGAMAFAPASRLQLMRGSSGLNVRINLNQVLIFSDVA